MDRRSCYHWSKSSVLSLSAEVNHKVVKQNIKLQMEQRETNAINLTTYHCCLPHIKRSEESHHDQDYNEDIPKLRCRKLAQLVEALVGI